MEPATSHEAHVAVYPRGPAAAPSVCPRALTVGGVMGLSLPDRRSLKPRGWACGINRRRAVTRRRLASRRQPAPPPWPGGW